VCWCIFSCHIIISRGYVGAYPERRGFVNILAEKITEDPEWVNSANVVLSTLRQEKDHDESWYDKAQRKAWWTCEDCPQPERWKENLTPSDFKEDRMLTRLVQMGSEQTWKWVVVKRCKRCNRMRDRHSRAQRSLGKVLAKQIEHVGTSARMITLTVPNEFLVFNEQGIIEQERLTGLARDLKAKMYAFSRTKAYQEKVIGAVEFYEQTYKISDAGVEVNTHIHAIWLGKYWAQDKLQEAWNGIVHITKPKSKRAVMKYISKYVTKDPIPGTRAKETRGVLRARTQPSNDGSGP